jgi:RimJ/RimL family protein N-acetyltransferase
MACGHAQKSTAPYLSAASGFSSRSTGPEPEIAYSLDQPFWRQGFATEAATAARDWFFEHFPLARVASFIRPDNHASKRVAERLGAACERRFELRGSTYEYWVHYRGRGHS